MTREEAEAMAAKRELHKPKSMTHRQWRAVHDPVKGWHAALVENHRETAQRRAHDARAALLRGDMAEFQTAASDALLAGCRAAIDESPPQ